MPGKRRSRTTQSNGFSAIDCSAISPEDDRRRLDIAVADQIADRLALDRIVLDDEQVLDPLVDERLDVREAVLQRLLT